MGCDGASILELTPGRSFHLWMDATCRLLTGWPLMKQTAVTEFKPWREAHRCLQEGAWSLHSDGQMLCKDKERDTKNLWWNDLSQDRAYNQPANREDYKPFRHLKTSFPLQGIISRTFGMTLFKLIKYLFIHASEGTEPNKSSFTSQWLELNIKLMLFSLKWLFSVFNTGFLITTEIVLDLSDDLEFTVASSIFI